MEPLCCFGNRRHVYFGEKCIHDSVEFMFFHPSNAGAICIGKEMQNLKTNTDTIFFLAHYGSGMVRLTYYYYYYFIISLGYDFHFILNALLERDHIPKKIMCRDLRLISMTVGWSCILKDRFFTCIYVYLYNCMQF